MRRSKFLSCIIAVAFTAACGGSDKAIGPTLASISGTYDLKTINGSNLPFVVAQTGSNKTEITADVVTATGSAFTELLTVRATQNGQVTTQTFSDAGSFTLNGNAVTFAYQDGSTGTGTVSGNTFTVAVDGFSFFYQKR